MTDVIQVFTTVANKEDADRLARHMVEQRLAACAQVIGPIESTYWWQGQMETAQEYLILLKSRAELYPELEAELKAQHPYEVPEILAVPVSAGNPSYFAWLRSELRPRRGFTL